MKKSDTLLLGDKMLSASRVTMDEVKMLFQGERRDTMYTTRCSVWTESQRMAYRQMRMEDF